MADKDKASGRVFNSRLRALDSLRISVEALSKECDRLEKKIREEQLTGYYSINSDVLRWARRVPSACYELSILRECQVYIDGDCGRIEKLGKETHYGTQNQETAQPSGEGTAPSYASDRWEGARRVLCKWRRRTSVEASSTSNCRQAAEGKQECMSRSGCSVMWRLEALALIALGMGLGYLLLGAP